MAVRIAFCITTLDTGGAERQLVELITRLPRDRFDPTVAVLSAAPQPPTDALLQALIHHRVPTTFLNAQTIWQTPQTWQRLSRWLRAERPQLLQCYLAHANVLGALAAHRAGVPHIVAGIRVAEQRNNGHAWMQRRIAPYVDRFVCLSRSVADFAVETMRLPHEKVMFIPNGIDAQRFAPSKPIDFNEFGIPPRRRVILFVGRLDPQKRLDWLLARMPAIAHRLPNHDLVLAGKGPLQNSLLRQAKQLGVASRVHLIGWQPNVAGLYAAADVVVLTSAWEGMPNVVLEAMAAARPIVATETHGIVEMLGDDSQGQVTSSDDADGFVDAVAGIAGNTELGDALGSRNRQRVIEQLSIEKTVLAYVDLYDSLLRQKTLEKSPAAR